MNKKNAKDYLPLVQALADGKVIQMICSDGTYEDLADPCFIGDAIRYRIKPEPREIWVNEYLPEDSVVHFSREDAEKHCAIGGVTRRYREVIE